MSTESPIIKPAKNSKAKKIYECQHCGCQQAKWSGQCTDCETWNSLVEVVVSAKNNNNNINNKMKIGTRKTGRKRIEC
jgi:predicted ATP-dependent serine protease